MLVMVFVLNVFSGLSYASRWGGTEVNSGSKATLQCMEELGGAVSGVLSAEKAPYYRNWFSTDRSDSTHLKSSYIYDTRNQSTVLELVGPMHLRSDEDLKYNSKYVFSADVRKGRMTSGEFAGAVLDYGNDLLDPVSYLHTAMPAVSTPDQGYAGVTGLGFTFLSESDDTVRFFFRYADIGNSGKIDVIYYDYNTGCSLKSGYHTVSVYDDKQGGTVNFYFDGVLACYITVSGSASSVSSILIGNVSGRSLDGDYYTAAALYTGAGELVGSADNKALIGSAGTVLISVSGPDDSAYFDNIATGDYSSLPDLSDCILGNASMSLSDDITLNINLRGAPTNMTGSLVINGNPSSAALPAYLPADASQFTMRFTKNGKSTTVSPVNNVFSYPGITMNEMTEDIRIELLSGETVIDSVDDFTLKDYLTLVYNSSDDELFRVLIGDLLNLGGALQEYSEYNLDNLAYDSSMTVSEPVRPETYTRTRTGNTTYNTITAASLMLNNVVNIYFSYSITDASHVRIDILNRDSVIASYDGSELTTGEGYVSTGGIFACDYDEVYTAELSYDGVKYCSVSYNVLAYLNAKWEASGEKLQKVVKCLSAYNRSALAYREANGLGADGYFDVSYETVSCCDIGDSIVLNAEFIGDDGTVYGNIAWSSKNTDIATVDGNGTVTGVSAGNAVITAYSKDTGNKFDFTVTVLPENMSDALRTVVKNHNSNAHVSYNVPIGDGTPSYYYDFVGSVNNILFTDLIKDGTYYGVLNGLGDPGKNYGLINDYGGVQFITVHYTGNMTYTADADNNADYFNYLSYQASIHWVTGRTNLYGPYSVDEYRAFNSLNEMYAGWHAGDSQRPAHWLPSGVYVMSGDPVKPVISISSGYYTINGRRTAIIAPGTASQLNKLGVGWKISDGQYYLDETWYCEVYGHIGNTGGNLNSIGIESCVDKGSDLDHTWHVTAQLCAELMVKYNLDISRVVGHHFFSGKDCPQPLLANNLELWNEFIKYVEAEYELLASCRDADITMNVINGEGVLGKYGLLRQDTDAHCVTYEVTVTAGGKTETITLATVVESSLNGPAGRVTLQTEGVEVI